MKIYFLTIVIAFLLPLKNFAQVPQILFQPENVTFCVDNEGSVEIEASGVAPLTYEWYKDDVLLTAYNTNVMFFETVAASDAGAYYCIVSNALGSDTTTMIQVDVLTELPEVLSVTSGGDFCEHSEVILSVTVNEDLINYLKWYKDDVFTGIYGSSITLTDLESQDAGVYYCELINACGSTQSDDININVIEEVVIVTQPVGQVVCASDDVTFTLEAIGTGLQYQWYENTIEMPGENDSQLTIEAVQSGNYNTYYCEVSNVCNTVESNPVGMTINTYPEVTAHPLSNTVCVGESVSLTSTASGTPTIIGEWFVNGEIVNDSVNNTITLNVDTYETLFVYRAYTNGCGTVYSDSAEIIPAASPSITEQPADTIGCYGQDVFLKVKVIGTGPFTYQWQFNGVNVYGPEFSGENSFELSISGLHEGHSGLYSCVIYNDCDQIVSDSAELSVILPPNIVSQPDEISVCEGDTATFEMIVQGSEPFEFAWMSNGSDEIISSDPYLTINSVTPDDDTEYYCIVSNVCADVSTDSVSLNVKTLPEFLIQPEDIDACHGDSVALEVSITGTNPMQLLWFRNEGALSGEEEGILVLNPAETLETGYFFCVAMNECGITESDEVFVNIGTSPYMIYHPFDQSLCENEPLTLYSGGTGENVFYQWYNNGEEIPGQTDTILNIPVVDDEMEGEYFLQAYNGCAAVNSDTAYVEIAPAPEFDLGEDQHFCEGESIVLSTDVFAQSFSWNNGENTTASYEVSSTGEYTLAAIGGNGCTGYDTVYVEVHPYYDINLGQDVLHCGPFSLFAGEGAYAYLWNTGSTNSNIEVTETGSYYCTTQGDEFGCASSDTIEIEILEIPEIDLGDEHTITLDSLLNLSVDEGYAYYYWSNGANMHETVYSGDYLGIGTHQAWVLVSHENGCVASDTVQIIVLQAESVGQIKTGEMVSIYPNPAKESVTFEFDLYEPLVKLNVVDVNGRIVLSLNENQHKGNMNINLNRLQSGLYIINLQTKSRSINYQLIKE